MSPATAADDACTLCQDPFRILETTTTYGNASEGLRGPWIERFVASPRTDGRAVDIRLEGSGFIEGVEYYVALVERSVDQGLPRFSSPKVRVCRNILPTPSTPSADECRVETQGFSEEGLSINCGHSRYSPAEVRNWIACRARGRRVLFSQGSPTSRPPENLSLAERFKQTPSSSRFSLFTHFSLDALKIDGDVAFDLWIAQCVNQDFPKKDKLSPLRILAAPAPTALVLTTQGS
jgi:hypothetical protein